MFFEVKPLMKNDEEDFKKLTTYYISLWYDDIDNSFAENILKTHQLGYDPAGYFTKKKIIWGGYLDHKLIGFLVATEKRGGSVKLAPGIIKPEYQKTGYGTQLWKNVESYYKENQYRKLYNTGPICRKELLNWVTSLGLELEGQLKEHYRIGQDDYVVGKIINTSTNIKLPPTNNEFSKIKINYTIRDLHLNDQPAIEKFLLNNMTQYYDEIDRNFIISIFNATQRFEETFKQKGKKVLVVEHNNMIIGICVATPKRGKSVKIVPLIIDKKFMTQDMTKDLIKQLEGFFKKLNYRKFYSILPIQEIDIMNLLKSEGYKTEGLIKEPYKPGIDNIILGKFLS